MLKETFTPPLDKSPRHKGSAFLLIVVIAAIIMSMIALSTAKISQASLGSLGSSKIALQAQQYAAAKADIVKATDYDELTAQALEEIPNSNFYDEVIIGSETLYPGKDDIYQRICTVNVYQYGDVLPRYSLKVAKTCAAGLPICLKALPFATAATARRIYATALL